MPGDKDFARISTSACIRWPLAPKRFPHRRRVRGTSAETIFRHGGERRQIDRSGSLCLRPARLTSLKGDQPCLSSKHRGDSDDSSRDDLGGRRWSAPIHQCSWPDPLQTPREERKVHWVLRISSATTRKQIGPGTVHLNLRGSQVGRSEALAGGSLPDRPHEDHSTSGRSSVPRQSGIRHV